MRVGITGHQNLGDKSTLRWVEAQLEAKLKEVKPHAAFSSLAIGADQLFARKVLELHVPLTAIIPCENYETTFKVPDREVFNDLLNKSCTVIKLPFDAPTEEAFFEAGKVVVDHSDLLIAVWNGKPAKGLGGTADIVHHARLLGKQIFHINLENKVLRLM